MKTTFKSNLFVTLPILLSSLIVHANAEDLQFEEGEGVAIVQEDLTFTENEVEVIDANNTKNIVRECYYYNRCPKHLTREDLSFVFGGDEEWILRIAGRKPPDSIPFVDPVIIAGACNRLRAVVNEQRTRLVRSARRYLGGSVLAKDEQCATFLQAIKAEGAGK